MAMKISLGSDSQSQCPNYVVVSWAAPVLAAQLHMLGV